MVENTPVLTEPTLYAKRYGTTGESFLGPFKSGLTPLLYPPRPPDTTEPGIRRLIRTYQNYYLDGFETSQFIASGAALDHTHQDPTILPSNLTGIHPLFTRDKWETSLPRHLAFYPIRRGKKNDYWTASNDDVWAILQPCLALASKLMDNFHWWPWWDALMFSTRTAIDLPPHVKDDIQLARFRLRQAGIGLSPVNSPEALQCARNGFKTLCSRIKLGISAPRCKPASGLSDNINWYGITMSGKHFSKEEDEVRVHLSMEDLRPLMDGMIPTEERLMQQAHVAVTLVHEIAHALNLAMSEFGQLEPYFEDESVSELGFSLENQIFGGHSIAPTIHRRANFHKLRWQPPLALTMSKGWPDFRDATENTNDQPILDKQLLAGNSEVEIYSIPLIWLSRIQQESFWNHDIFVYGKSALEPHPLTLGIRLISTFTPNPPPEDVETESDEGAGEDPLDGDWIPPDQDGNSQDEDEESLNVNDDPMDIYDDPIEVDEKPIHQSENPDPDLTKLNEEEEEEEELEGEAHDALSTKRIVKGKLIGIKDEDYPDGGAGPYAYTMNEDMIKLNAQIREALIEFHEPAIKEWVKATREDRSILLDWQVEIDRWDNVELRHPNESYPAITALITRRLRWMLELDEMVDWTPANLLLSYVNGQVQDPVPVEDFYGFLESCQRHGVYFTYMRQGYGAVARIPRGWGSQLAPHKPLMIRGRFHSEIRKAILGMRPYIHLGVEELRDIDKELMYQRIKFLCPEIMSPLTVKAFKDFMNYCDYANDLYVKAPGIYRRIDNGWPKGDENLDADGKDDDEVDMFALAFATNEPPDGEAGNPPTGSTKQGLWPK